VLEVKFLRPIQLTYLGVKVLACAATAPHITQVNSALV